MPPGDPAGYLPRVQRDRDRKRRAQSTKANIGAAGAGLARAANLNRRPTSRGDGGPTNPFGAPTFNRGRGVRAESRIVGGGQRRIPEDSMPGTTYRPRHARGANGQKRPT